MADFKAKRRSEAEIRKVWEADAPIKSAELAVIMSVPRGTVSEWSRKGMPRVGWLIRKCSFDTWWNCHARKTGRPKSKPQPKKEPSAANAIPVLGVVRETPTHNLPPRAAKLMARAEAAIFGGKAGALMKRANR